ncbi:SMI1/KNR4 family protein [Streptomyces sp. NPDC088725]|uniref:SMI1/KNR4 family protein n=1 Tax=Streptomyces sp. NPDC088725 TaxID=3365873 RepID=UPI003810154B
MSEQVRRLKELLAADTVSIPSPDWAAIEAELHAPLPSDYKEFIEQAGGGNVDNYLYVLAPASPNQHYDLLEATAERDEAYEDLFDFEDKPAQLEPEGSRIIPWATTDNGEWLFWRILPGQNPADYAILVNEARGEGWEFHELGFAAYLTGILDGTIQSDILSSRFPTHPHTWRPFTDTPNQ